VSDPNDPNDPNQPGSDHEPDEPPTSEGAAPPPPGPDYGDQAPRPGAAEFPPPPPADPTYPPPPGPTGAPGGPPPATGPGGAAFAEWPLRVQSALVDWFGPGLVAGLFQRTSIYWVLALAALIWAFYNAWLGGETGQSYGKRWAGTRVVKESDGSLIGGPMGIVRHLAHIVDAIICFIGFLFPLWDTKRQALSDKIVSTVVVKV
jgi:uncharacterized RDD family membrane protein YckC